MPSVVYIIRSPLDALSQALFKGDSSAAVLSLEDPILQGKVLRTTNGLGLEAGQRLSYDEIVSLLLNAEKVITL